MLTGDNRAVAGGDRQNNSVSTNSKPKSCRKES
jgi:hypothetical protein